MDSKEIKKSFVLATNKEQEDLAFRLYCELSFWTSIPVIVYDISENGLELFKRNNVPTVRLKYVENFKKHPWFLKPAVLMDAFETNDKIVFLDNDIEIIDQPDSIFDTIDSGMAMAKDWGRPQMHNSGVIVLASLGPLITKWHQFSIDAEIEARGDQEILNILLEKKPEYRAEITLLDDKYNWQRFKIADGHYQDGRATIVHWHGPTGKKILRDKHKL